ncbi:YpmA family protein [Effusibacillus consociatus]|uniref:YpmA family protein n=1 Tax=Effusibacillus consociatus TaxID=1117041 RepID=A0ABV9Q581_9BACL
MDAHQLDTHELEVLATVQVETDNFYKIVDFLNRTLKPYKLIFGLSKAEDGSLWMSIYESTEHTTSH